MFPFIRFLIFIFTVCLSLLIFQSAHAIININDCIIDKWSEYKCDLATRIQAIMGHLPELSNEVPEMIVECKEEFSDFCRLKITYEAEDNIWVPAYLLIPKPLAHKCVGILCLHQTSQKGCGIVAGVENLPDDEYAVELVKLGYVCLCPSYPLLGQYQPDLKQMGYQSGTMKAIVDNIRGLDLLESLPFVKQGTFGVIGHSLGGHNGIFTAFFDNRIKVIITSCGFDSFHDYKQGNLTGWTSDRYMPLLKDYSSAYPPFDFDEIIASFAPRAFFCSAPIYDTNFMTWSVQKLSIPIIQIYSLCHCPENAAFIYPEEKHRFSKSIRNQAYNFLMFHLPLEIQ